MEVCSGGCILTSRPPSLVSCSSLWSTALVLATQEYSSRSSTSAETSPTLLPLAEWSRSAWSPSWNSQTLAGCWLSPPPLPLASTSPHASPSTGYFSTWSPPHRPARCSPPSPPPCLPPPRCAGSAPAPSSLLQRILKVSRLPVWENWQTKVTRLANLPRSEKMEWSPDELCCSLASSRPL